jgi:Ca-activated chloride channel homolog
VRRLPVLARLCALLTFASVALAPVEAVVVATASASATSGTSAKNSLLLLFDASGSMRESAGGGLTKIAAAKRALNDVVRQLPATSNVGLRVYGATKDHGCDDTTLVHPVTQLDRAGLRAAIRGFQPRGDTPIGASLRAAAKDLADKPGRKTIVLVSDGEDTCTPPSTCAVARELKRQGVDLRVESIGFRVNAVARAQLSCVAKVTGGSYYDAPDSRALTGQLEALSLRAFRTFTPLGTPITGTPDAAGAPAMAPGAWVDELAPGETRTYTIDVPDGAVPVVNGALIAGATQPRLGLPENFLVIISAPDGSECARGASSQTVRSFTAGATATGPRAAAGSGSPCTEPGRRIVSAQRQLDDGQGTNTVELLYSQLGSPDPSAPPAAAVQPGPAGGATGTPTSVRGGTSYDDAPPLGPGSWQDTLRASETIYYRVPVGWGQRLTVTAQFTSLTAGQGLKGSMQPVLEVHDALRVDPHNRKVVQLAGAAPMSVSIKTPPVTAPATATDPVAPFKIAGDEYVVLNGAKLLGADSVAAARVRLTLAVDGAQVEGPRLAVAGAASTTSPSPTATASPSASRSAQPDDTPSSDATPAQDGSGVPGWLWAFLGVAAPAVVGGVVAVTRRRAPRS